QADLLLSREPIEKILNSPEKDRSLSPDDLKKLKLALEAKSFGERVLGLKKNGNYASYVQLDRPYVSYIVSAAARDRLEPHLWSFPIVGAVPYKGYFNLDDAKEEANNLKAKGLDTYVRGATAYSTLGWFDDPVLSSMLRYSDYDLVNLIVHESVHATLYIKSQADFNERLATFIGDLGAELYFKEKEGTQSSTLIAAAAEREDDKAFSVFISKEIDRLKDWYPLQNAAAPEFEELKRKRLGEILEAFDKDLAPKLTNEKYRERLRRDLDPSKLNNASLLAWKTYVYDLADFQSAFEKMNHDPVKFLEFAKSLEKSKDPEADLKAYGRKPSVSNDQMKAKNAVNTNVTAK
ncbi:MAG: aminopeptidase, partial [Bdellovibrionales bacterium]|nr:aminopeptidase [Bdellovibrionales bacterium]